MTVIGAVKKSKMQPFYKDNSEEVEDGMDGNAAYFPFRGDKEQVQGAPLGGPLQQVPMGNMGYGGRQSMMHQLQGGQAPRQMPGNPQQIGGQRRMPDMPMGPGMPGVPGVPASPER